MLKSYPFICYAIIIAFIGICVGIFVPLTFSEFEWEKWYREKFPIYKTYNIGDYLWCHWAIFKVVAVGIDKDIYDIQLIWVLGKDAQGEVGDIWRLTGDAAQRYRRIKKGK